ncbi:tubulin-specific chaperone E [Lepeophtheirus salmonis]|uniref:tubulin-specific chaperone E n=1 Tax=Lepeophtheirus salmonis TaxID=72036 RepID=UPI001AE8A4F0|nr:tubulin-specific chaperone E-like [Lepeophtheirus salmonis]
MNEVRAVGTRVEDLKGFRGSIRYVGSVGSTQGEWLGIEWDDASRGKHNGTHNGIHYFEAAPLGGSFVRVSKIKSGKGIREAVEDRYGSKHADEEFRPEDILEIQRGMKASLFEIVGMDKVRQAQKDYGKLNVISLRNMCVQFIDGDLKDFMPNVMSLDLGENLLHSWDEVFYIIKDLSHLKYLCVSENRLLTPRKSLPFIPPLKHLVLGRMNYNWNEIYSIIQHIPSLENLQIHGNTISSIDHSSCEIAATLPNLRELDLNLNPLVKWKHVSKFSKCQHLESLMLNDCKLTEIDEIDEGFPLLNKIELNCNDFKNWKTLGHLNSLPSLKEVRLKGNELRGVLPSFQPMNRRLSPRQTTIAMLGRITILNGTEIDRQERIGAEIDYWKMFGLDYIEAKKKDTSFSNLPPRYVEIVAMHGEPDESELRGKDSTMDDMFLNLTLKRKEEIRNKKVPLTMTIKALKILSKKLFKAPNLKDMELYYTTEKSKDVSIPLDDDMREISYFGVINGDTIRVHW